jgi:hypothetical protein
MIAYIARETGTQIANSTNAHVYSIKESQKHVNRNGRSQLPISFTSAKLHQGCSGYPSAGATGASTG